MDSLNTLAAALSYAMGIEPPACAAEKNEALSKYVDEALGGRKADRIFMYNPDAIAYWLQRKYPYFVETVQQNTDLAIPFWVPFPPVTPVCFGTMYTGAEPQVHGIVKYERPVIRIDTLFDALIRAGKKPLIISIRNCSMSLIFNERPMDYIVKDTVEEANAAAAEAILADEHDFIAVYNSNFDSRMHRTGPEDPRALAEMRYNDRMFGTFADLIRRHWTTHDTLMGYGMDHGCHARYKEKETGLSLGDHGYDMPEDREVCHYFKAIPASK